MLLGVRWGSLRAKIIAWSFVPTALVLSAVAVIAVQAFQHLAVDLVVDRDRELTRLYAGEVAAVLDAYGSRLAAVAAAADVAADPEAARDVLYGSMGERLAVFDGGIVIVDHQGKVTAARPSGTVPVGDDWSERPFFARLASTGARVISDLEPLSESGIGPRVYIAEPIPGTHGETRGAVIGILDPTGPTSSPFQDELAQLPIGRGGLATLADGRGHVVYSSDPALVGVDLSTGPEVRAALGGDAGTRRGRDAGGRDVLTSYAPVPGSSWALLAVEPWAEVTNATRRYGQVLLVLLGVGLTIPALVVAVGVRRITSPVNELIAAAKEVAKGQFGRTIQADTGDEIEELARQFNAMSAQLDASYRQMENRVTERTRQLAERNEAERRRADQFRVISDVSRRMTSILPLDELLGQIVRLIQQAFRYDHVGIGLVEGEHVQYAAGAGPIWEGATATFEPGRLRVGVDGVTGFVAGSGEPVLIPDVSRDSRYIHLEGSGTRSEVAVPIIANGIVIGVLDAQSRRPAAFDESDLTVMQALANQAGIAIENARLYARARQLAVLEERQRVARDLHDSVTQSLYGVTLYGDAAARLIEADDVPGATEYLTQLRQSAKDALAEMRLLVFELRPMELEQIGLVGALQARLDAVESRAGLVTALEVEDGPRPPLAVEEALYRIAQEALNNALKHAQAKEVRLLMHRPPGAIALEIEDDGDGFDPFAARRGGGIGLHSMTERAENVGGTLEIDSAPGSGTRVRVEVPL